MPSSVMFRRVALLVTLMMEALGSSETSVITRATLRNFSGYGILRICAVHTFTGHFDLVLSQLELGLIHNFTV
jgi:hypothetical protein